MIKIFKMEARRGESLIEVDEESSYVMHQNIHTTESVNPSALVSTNPRLMQTEEIKDQGNAVSGRLKGKSENSLINDNESFITEGKDESFELILPSDRDLTYNARRNSKKGGKRYIRKTKELIITNSNEFELRDEFLPAKVHKLKRKGVKPLGKLYNAIFRKEDVI